MKKIYFSTVLAFLLSASAVIAQTPYASYPLDGNANDVSSNGLNGTITGSPSATTNRTGQTGKAMLFNGTSDYIVLPTDFDFPNRTVIVWFNVLSTPSGNGNVIYASDHANLQNGLTGFQIINSLGSITLRMVAEQAGYNTTVSLNTWYQIAITRTPLLAKYFINGALVYSTAATTGHSSNGTNNATVGCDRNYAGKTDGKIDDLLIYNSALPDADITANYTSLKDVHEIEEHLNVYTEAGNVVCKFLGDLNSEVKSVKLMDIAGRILSEKQGAFSGVVNENDLPAGTYIVSVEVENAARLVSRKVVIAK